MSNTNLIPIEKIEKAIYLIRGEKVMLDRDLAELYEVKTEALNQAVRRNRDRFPKTSCFSYVRAEVARTEPITICDRFREASRSSFSALCFHRTGRCHAIECVTKQTGDNCQHRDHACVCKASTMIASNAELSRRLDELESKYDKQFRVVFDAIRQLMATPVRSAKR